jgi:Concanavalin A-like lectin/glucanases superfamily/Calcineurin-like phosphoesterase
MTRLSVLFLSAGLALGGLLGLAGPALADPPAIHTNRPNPGPLPLPKGDDVFHFLIFGDRTGGPPDGVKILAQAVRDANRLDPDLVMTVGDLVQGYNAETAWDTQMKEYRGVMQGLRMPWFPVAGNHDIFWRGEGRPPTEHEAQYEKHFGPLWYWFEHKKCAFIVLFSDEGAGDNRVRSFEDPAQQQFSKAQKTWLQQSLAEMKTKGIQHAFCFLHHPRWATDLYPQTDWPEVHSLLRDSGIVRGCFAGHIHRLRYDGLKDGIEYIALAATGASIPGLYPGLGYLHHYNLVTVRPSGIKVSTIPVGAVMEPKQFTLERQKDIDAARKMNPELTGDPMRLDADGLGAGTYTVSFKNPAQRALDVTLTAIPSGDWVISPDHAHAEVGPGADRSLSFTWVRVKKGLVGKIAPPVFDLSIDYLEDGTRQPFPIRKYPAIVRLSGLPESAFAIPTAESGLHILADKSGVRVESAQFDVPDGPFTLEAWVRPDELTPNAAIVSKTQTSDYGFLSENGIPSFLAYLGDRYASATAKTPLIINQWSHLAGVYDGTKLSLYVNGTLVDQVNATGFRQRNDLPLWIGADPNAAGEPTRSWKGWIDEVRLSQGARYTQPFDPAHRHSPDPQTILLFHLDDLHATIVPDHSASQAHGTTAGTVQTAVAP